MTIKSFRNHDELIESGLWANIHKRRKAGKAPKKPGDKGYPKTLDIEAVEAPTMLAKRDDEKKKIKTGLDKLRKALGPDHVMNKSAAKSEGIFFGKKGPAVVSRLARGVASRVSTKGKLDRAKKKQGKLDDKINLAKTRDSNTAKKAELRKMRTDKIKSGIKKVGAGIKKVGAYV